MMQNTNHGRAGALLRDPLIHFLCIGLVLFGVERGLASLREDPDRMEVNSAVYNNLVDIFAETNGRAPDPAEMHQLVGRWVMNEALFREAKALRLDEGDEMIRERVMQKMRVMIQSGVAPKTPSDAETRAWFEENRSRYDVPARLTLRLARLDGTEAEARELAGGLAAGDTDGVQILPFGDRPRPALLRVFGEPMIERIESLPQGEWHPIETEAGWQVAILDEFVPATPAAFEDVAMTAAADWQDDRQRRDAAARVEELIAQWTLEISPYDPQEYQERVAEALRVAAGG